VDFGLEHLPIHKIRLACGPFPDSAVPIVSIFVISGPFLLLFLTV
jgi:hypothetical protein